MEKTPHKSKEIIIIIKYIYVKKITEKNNHIKLTEIKTKLRNKFSGKLSIWHIHVWILLKYIFFENILCGLKKIMKKKFKIN